MNLLIAWISDHLANQGCSNDLVKIVYFLVSITVCEWILNYIFVLHISNTYKHVYAYCLDFRQTSQPRVQQGLGIIVYVLGINC